MEIAAQTPKAPLTKEELARGTSSKRDEISSVTNLLVREICEGLNVPIANIEIKISPCFPFTATVQLKNNPLANFEYFPDSGTNILFVSQEIKYPDKISYSVHFYAFKIPGIYDLSDQQQRTITTGFLRKRKAEVKIPASPDRIKVDEVVKSMKQILVDQGLGIRSHYVQVEYNPPPYIPPGDSF